MKANSVRSATWITVITMWSLTGGALITTAKEVREEFHQTYPLAENGRVSVENVNGRVSIAVWDRNEVKVDAVKRGASQKDLEAVTIDISAESDHVRVETDYTHSKSGWFGWFKNPSTSVDYTLTVPRQVRLDGVSTVNGELTLDGVQGRVKGSSVNGEITASGLGGETALETVNGGIHVSFAHLDPAGAVRLESVNGGITVTIPANAGADVEAGTVNGGISTDGDLTVKSNSPVGHEVKGRLGEGGTRIKLETVNGGIQIRRGGNSSRD